MGQPAIQYTVLITHGCANINICTANVFFFKGILSQFVLVIAEFFLDNWFLKRICKVHIYSTVYHEGEKVPWMVFIFMMKNSCPILSKNWNFHWSTVKYSIGGWNPPIVLYVNSVKRNSGNYSQSTPSSRIVITSNLFYIIISYFVCTVWTVHAWLAPSFTGTW